jgi:hypothetical protein
VEAGAVLELVMRGDGGRAGTSQFKASAGSGPATDGKRNANGNTWAITRRKNLRRARTGSTSRTASIL